jgi:predicted DNA-binding helix-hairpin-helix protein
MGIAGNFIKDLAYCIPRIQFLYFYSNLTASNVVELIMEIYFSTGI